MYGIHPSRAEGDARRTRYVYAYGILTVRADSACPRCGHTRVQSIASLVGWLALSADFEFWSATSIALRLARRRIPLPVSMYVAVRPRRARTHSIMLTIPQPNPSGSCHNTSQTKALDHRRPELGARARLPSDRCCLRSHPRTRTWPPSPLSTLLSSCAGGGGGREATGTGTGRVPRISKLNNSALTLFVIRNKRYSHT